MKKVFSPPRAIGALVLGSLLASASPTDGFRSALAAPLAAPLAVAAPLAAPAGSDAALARSVVVLAFVWNDAAVETPENREVFERAFENAARRYSARYPVDFATEGYDRKKRQKGSLAVQAFRDDKSGALTVIAKDDRDEVVDSIVLSVTDRRALDTILPSVLFSFWARFQAPSSPSGGPVPVCAIDLRAIAPLLSESPSFYPTPVAIASAGARQAWLAVGDRVVRLGRFLTVEETFTLSETGTYVMPFRLSSSNSGTLWLSTLTGDIYKYRTGGKPERVALGAGQIFSFAQLTDGTIAYWEASTQKTYRLEGKRKTAFALPGIEYMAGIMASDEDGKLWVYDYGTRSVVVFLGDGTLVDFFRVALPDNQTPIGILPTVGRGFYLYSQRGLSAFDTDGFPRWHAADLSSPLDGDVSILIGAALDRATGAIWLADMAKATVSLYYDPSLVPGVDLAQEMAMAAATAKTLADPEDAKAQEDRADLADSLGSPPVAYSFRLRADSLVALSDAARLKMTRFEVATDLARARHFAAQTLSSLERWGTETARPFYSQALVHYERYIARASGDPFETANLSAARAEKAALERAFAERAAPSTAPPPPAPVVASATIGPFFPAMLASYSTLPSCFVTVENATGKTVDQYVLRVDIKGYLDFPAETRVPGPFPPGTKTAIALPIPLNRTVLELQEDLDVQARVEVVAIAGATQSTGSRIVTATIRNRSAISWKDSGALASFVTPNDESIAAFARESLVMAGYSGGGRVALLSPAFSRAQVLVDALGSLGFSYVEDPKTPIVKVLGSDAIDVVRFPRFTLFTRAGDCDDTTALVASLLESAGVQTAIVTTPGHVLLAFDTGEPAAAAWLYSTAGAGAIVRDGTIWIPVETTVLSEGFASAWEKGWRAWNSGIAAGAAEFLPIAALRAKYPPIPLASAANKAPLPSHDAFSAFDSRARAVMETRVYQPNKTSLESEIAKAADTTAKARLLNRAGILEAQFGRYDAAETRFLDAIKANPDYASSYMNLYRARELRNDVAGAEAALKLAVTRFPDSAPFAAAYAEFLVANGRASEAAVYVSKAKAGGILVGSAGSSESRGSSASGGSAWSY